MTRVELTGPTGRPVGFGSTAFAWSGQRMMLAAILAESAHTVEECALRLGVTQQKAEWLLWELRAEFDVERISYGDGRYRVRFPKGRVCACSGCGTVLRPSNPTDRCEHHGGGAITEARPGCGAEAARLRSEGYSIAKIAKTLGISEMGVYYHLRKSPEVQAHREAQREDAERRRSQRLEREKELRQLGYSFRRIAREVGVSGPTVRKDLEQAEGAS